MNSELARAAVFQHLDIFGQHTSMAAANELVNLYLRKTPPLLNLMETAIDEANYSKIEQLAHQLKSTSGFLGLHELQSTLEKLETAAINKDAQSFINLKNDLFLFFKEYSVILHEFSEKRKEPVSHEPSTGH